MHYYDPLYPLVENTRQEIQRSIAVLEDKLRLVNELEIERREIDFDIEMGRNEEISRRVQALAYEDELRIREASAQSNGIYSYAYDRALAENLINSKEEEEINRLRHLARIEELERERLGIDVERERLAYFGTGKKFRGRNGYDDEEESLIQKYENGTRQQEYKKSLDSYNNSRWNSNAKDDRRPKEAYFERSPYNNLKYDSEKKELAGDPSLEREGNRDRRVNYSDNKRYDKNEYRQREDEERRNQNRNENNFERNQAHEFSYKERTDGEKFKEGNLENEREFREKNQKQKKIENETVDQKTALSEKKKLASKGRSVSHKELTPSKKNKPVDKFSPLNYLESKMEISPNKSRRSGNKREVLERSRNTDNCAISAMQKIKNRLKLSEIVYKDSKFKNVKHELSHLFNTYNCEVKLRREIKEKINSHPITMKRHGMVNEK